MLVGERENDGATIMEKLLTIKEAASLLNVSAMSLRRWTNAGKLKCCRVGGNNERRFNEQDLVDFLHAGDQETIPLGIGKHRVADSSHIAHLYRTIDECVGDGISYLSQGLSRGEKILIVSTGTRLSRLLGGLENLGYPVSRLIDEGVIVTDTGRDRPDDQIQFMAKTILNTDSPSGFRLLGDMAWALERNWNLEDITMLENYTNNSLANQNKIFLCQYDIEIFKASTAMMALETHNLSSYRGELKISPYFLEAV